MKNLTVQLPKIVESQILSAFKNQTFREYNCADEIMLNRKFFMIHENSADEFLTNLLGITTDENLHVVNTMVFHFRWDCQRWEVSS
jgi:predicted NACHT family NTPase